ncbi:hypothetical protein [Veillonella intestinalis]|uniref:hypothetical protein n=1 Tax=Veillonella intestinalis TaxID=2941341 RepID=UPI0020424EE2|nr:hypothetical protein [Veillonella intestinalis]
MEKVTQREIRNYPAIDLSTVKSSEVYNIIKGKGKGKEVLYRSFGVYGSNGVVFTVDNVTYKIVGRTSNLFIVI